MHDFVNLIQVAAPFFLALLTWDLNSKKTNHDILKDDNARLIAELKSKDAKIDKLEKEIEVLKHEK